jgi:hypothetical protein
MHPFNFKTRKHAVQTNHEVETKVEEKEHKKKRSPLKQKNRGK